jgi:hypothetical protein
MSLREPSSGRWGVNKLGARFEEFYAQTSHKLYYCGNIVGNLERSVEGSTDEKGGERHETFYDSKSCSLQPGLQSFVPGMTLNCLNKINQPPKTDELDWVCGRKD